MKTQIFSRIAFWRIAAALCGTSFLSCASASKAQEGENFAPSPASYNPLRLGDRWTYQFRSEFVDQPVQYRVKTQIVEAGDNGAFAFVDEKGDYYLFTCDEEQLELHGERESKEIHTFSPPFVYLRRGMVEGKTYETQNKSSQGTDIRCEARYLGRCQEKTPAGDFTDCIRADFRYHLPTGNSFWIESTLAKGIGPVRKRYALEGKGGTVLARFEQELLSYRVDGTLSAGTQSLSLETFQLAASSGASNLSLEYSDNAIRLLGIRTESQDLRFASPVFLALPQMKEGIAYRSTVKDESGTKWNVTLFLREIAPDGKRIDLDLRFSQPAIEISAAISLQEGDRNPSVELLSWDRKGLRPLSLEIWPREASAAVPPTSDAIGRALLRNAHESRAVWPASFPGYRALARLEIQDADSPPQSFLGRVEVRSQGSPGIEGFEGEPAAWLERELVSIVSHRRHSAESVGREPRGRFVVEAGDPLKTVSMRLEGDPMGSSWTIENGRVAKVRRKEIGGTFEIVVLDTEKDAAGRYVPISYRVNHYSKEGAIKGWEDYRDRFEWIRETPILRSRSIEELDAAGGKLRSKKLSFEKIELFETEEPGAKP